MNAIDPVRIMDTRWKGIGKMSPGKRHEFGVDLATDVPADARVAFVNFTSTSSEGDGYVSFARPGAEIGGTSCLNMAKAITQTNMVIVPLADKKFSVQVYGSPTDLICDVFGYA